MNPNTDHLATMRTRFKQWDESVDALAAEGKKANGEARTAYERRLKELRLARKPAQRAYDALRTASGALAAQTQAGLLAAWETMQQALDKVTADLHAPPAETPPPVPQASAPAEPAVPAPAISGPAIPAPSVP
jgi:hypothetical protein